MKKIGLTGGSGIMGQTLRKNFPNFEWFLFEKEILNSEEIASWLKDTGPLDALIHLAAIVPTHLVEADPAQAIRVNVEGTCRLLFELQKNSKQIPWVFIASTAHVYASSPAPLTEESPLSPISLYGLTKLQAEQWALEFGKSELNICIGRIFSTSSPLHPDSYFLPSMIRKISGAPPGATLEVRGLHGTRDFLTADQVCQAIQFLMNKKSTGIFNVAGGQPLKLFDVVQKIKSRLGRNDIKIVPLEKDTSHLSGNVDKLKKLGFTPKPDLDELLDQLMPTSK